MSISRVVDILMAFPTLIFALMVPEHYTDEHLKILANLATLFNNEVFCKEIRNTSNNEDLYDHLIHWQLTSQAS